MVVKSKKGQITIFIIIGITILAVVSILIYMQTKEGGGFQTAKVPLEVQPIKAFVESCSKQTTENGLVFIGLQGGYYNLSGNFFNLGLFAFPYYFYEGSPFFPEKDSIRQELSKYVEKMLDVCLNNFSIFKEQGFEIKQKSSNVELQFTKKNILVKTYLALEIKGGEKSTRINDFISSVDFDFNTFYDILGKIKYVQMRHPDYVPIEPLTDLAEMYNFTFQITHFPNSSVVYFIMFDNRDIYRNTYLYAYAVKYKWENMAALPKEVEIEPIEKQAAYVGHEFLYQVKANGSNLNYSDYSSLFDINSDTGLINFTPAYEQAGKHFILIKVEDNKGNSDSKIFELDIKVSNRKPAITYIPNFRIGVNRLFIYRVNASDPDNDAIFYLDNTGLFDINRSTGLINFTTTEDMKGEHLINITVIDINELADTEKFKLVVE